MHLLLLLLGICLSVPSYSRSVDKNRATPAAAVASAVSPGTNTARALNPIAVVPGTPNPYQPVVYPGTGTVYPGTVFPGTTYPFQPGVVWPGTGTVNPGTVIPGTTNPFQPGVVNPGVVLPGTVYPGTVFPGTTNPYRPNTWRNESFHLWTNARRTRKAWTSPSPSLRS
ncbi:hypothetical protein RB195_003862 [Necator americanus]|uniref:Uncharacterized protein n=1 Tax=Necator americanus TaxID=51031 RepID=A0ABR1DS01_NECAM